MRRKGGRGVHTQDGGMKEGRREGERGWEGGVMRNRGRVMEGWKERGEKEGDGGMEGG